MLSVSDSHINRGIFLVENACVMLGSRSQSYKYFTPEASQVGSCFLIHPCLQGPRITSQIRLLPSLPERKDIIRVKGTEPFKSPADLEIYKLIQ